MKARRATTFAPSPRSPVSWSSGSASNSHPEKSAQCPVPSGGRDWALGTGHWALGTGHRALMDWLSQLPHQIPFRAASTGRVVDEKTIEGTFVCSAGDLATPEIMLTEAMAQLAGGLVFRE